MAMPRGRKSNRGDGIESRKVILEMPKKRGPKRKRGRPKGSVTRQRVSAGNEYLVQLNGGKDRQETTICRNLREAKRLVTQLINQGHDVDQLRIYGRVKLAVRVEAQIG